MKITDETAALKNTHLMEWLKQGYDHCQRGSKDWCEAYLNSAHDYILALEAAVADVPVPKAVKVDAERATEKLKLWFFRDLLDEHRTMLFGLFGMPVSEIRNQGDQVHAFRHVVAALAEPAPEALPADVTELVVAARIVAYEDQGPEALRDLDRAVEAFAERVPWDNDPTLDELPTPEMVMAGGARQAKADLDALRSALNAEGK